MSPTHHSTTTTNITLSKLGINSRLLNPSDSKKALDRSNFSCFSKPSRDGSQTRVYRDSENNNWVENLFPVENGVEVGSRVGSLEDTSVLTEEQRKDDLHYLGEGGFSRWSGEPGVGGWVRKMGYGERFMTGSTDFGVMSTVYNLWFESKTPVDLKNIEDAAQIVVK